jgi:hypothetical protein
VVRFGLASGGKLLKPEIAERRLRRSQSEGPADRTGNLVSIAGIVAANGVVVVRAKEDYAHCSSHRRR